MKLRIFVAILMCVCCWTTAQAAPPPVYVEEELVEQLMPDHTLIRGVVEEDKMYLLMQNAAGENVFVGGTQNAEGAWNCYESAPLPEGTILGVENYTTALGIPTENGLITTTVSPFHDGEWGVTEVSFRGGEPIRMGRTWISMSDPLNGVFCDHPWSDIAEIDWLTLPLNYEKALEKADDSNWCVFKPSEKAKHTALACLLTKPKTNAETVTKLWKGTPARIVETQGKWIRVAVGNVEGWIQKEHVLSGGEMGRTDAAPILLGTSKESTTFHSTPNADDVAYSIDGYVEVYQLDFTPNEYTLVWRADIDEYMYVSINDLCAVYH